MSVSEISTLVPTARDNEGSYQLPSGHTYGLGDSAVNSYKKSPYTDPDIISLDIGASQAKYRVHRVLLSQSVELDAKLLSEGAFTSIRLPDLDEVSAHTLVHYLYTGKYQALDSYESSKEGVLPGYKLGACVYCAATRYKLPGLAELARYRITSFGEDLTILDILSVAREIVFPGLPDDESWFPEYLEGAIKGAVLEDPDLFTRPEFVDQIEGDRKYRGVVMRAIVSTYSRGPIVSERHTGLSTPVAEPTFVEPTFVEPTFVEPTFVEPSFIEPTFVEPTFEEPSSTDVKELEPLSLEPIEPFQNEEHQLVDVTHAEETTDFPDFVEEDAIQPETVEPTAESPQAPEPFTDELGFGTSKTYQKLGKKSENGETEIIADGKPPEPAHKRSDSVIHVQDAVSVESLPVVEGSAVASPEPIETATVVDGMSNDAPALKKKNKRKKKKTPATPDVSTEI